MNRFFCSFQKAGQLGEVTLLSETYHGMSSLNPSCIIQGNPSGTGFQLTPSSIGTGTALNFDNGIYAFRTKTIVSVIRSRAFADIQIGNVYLNQKIT